MRALAAALVALTAAGQTPLTDRIDAASLRGHLSFLASDVLEGRETPSRGLDVAAEYIASEFRSAGLEGPRDYFQVADFIQVSNRWDGFQLSLAGAGETKSVSTERVRVTTMRGVHLAGASVFKWAPDVKMDASLAGKVLMLRKPSDAAVLARLELTRPEAVVLLERKLDSEQPETPLLEPVGKRKPDQPAVISAREGDLEGAFDRLPNGNGPGRVTLNVPDPLVKQVELRNVIGVLRGSDPELRNQAVVISAHYDHLGIASSGGRHRIYNGANDDGSGVVTVIELARAFAREDPHPKRTLVFMAFFGEEEGLLGSAYYVQHPLFPLANTAADINFEQLGEPNPDDGLRAGGLGVTGYEFSDLPALFAKDAPAAGVHVEDTSHNRAYFARSDNYSFAQAGVPAHTFVAAYDYPDYHRVTDTWDKLNYDNMAKLDRAIALSIRDVANRADVPRWSESSPDAKPYLNAWNALHRK